LPLSSFPFLKSIKNNGVYDEALPRKGGPKTVLIRKRPPSNLSLPGKKRLKKKKEKRKKKGPEISLFPFAKTEYASVAEF
jgi:hypothetical protein